MENFQPAASQMHTSIGPLKESIRDMIRLERDYQIPDELFWQIFNARVLLNEPVDINAFVSSFNSSLAQA